jgi:hypothetical protein
MLNLYSKRFSTARGWYWKLERDTLPENAKAWLAVFQKDEPEIEFKVAAKTPK